MNADDVAHIIASRVIPQGRDDAVYQVMLDNNMILVRMKERDAYEDFIFVCHKGPFSEEMLAVPARVPSLPQVPTASEASGEEDENAHATGPQPIEEVRTPESGPPGQLRSRR